jgi:hypothetical protein
MKKFLAVVLISFLSPIYGHALDADDYYGQGYTEYQAGNWQAAVGNLKGAIGEDPNDWQAYELLGYSYYRLNDIKQCLHNCKISLRIHPNNPTLQNFVDSFNTQSTPSPLSQSPNTFDSEDNQPMVAPPTNSLPPDNSVVNNAVPEKTNSFYVNFGAATPYAPSDFNDGWTSGGSFGIGYGFGLNKVTSIVLSGQYSSFPLNLTEPGYTISGGAFHTLMFLVNGKFVLVGADNPVDFYLIAGLGAAIFTSDPLTVTDNSNNQSATESATALTETDLALRFGLGIDIRLTKGFFLTIESNGIDTFVSQEVASNGYLTNNLFTVGLKINAN